MATQRITGEESWQELRDRGIAKYNQVRERRGETREGPHPKSPISTVDVTLLCEANFLVSLAEMVAARGRPKRPEERLD